MYVKTGIYVYFSLFAALGMLLGILLCGSFGFSPQVTLYSELLFASGGKFDLEIAERFIGLLKPVILIFLSGFTIYAAALSVGSVVLNSAVLGSFMLTLSQSSAAPPIYLCGVVLCTATLAFQVYMGSCAVTQREYLRTASPKPSEILSSTYGKAYILKFLTASAILLILTAAIYFIVPIIISH